MIIRTLIVDDVALARRRIRRFLRDEAAVAGQASWNQAAIEVTGECADGREAVEAIAAVRPDLMFLDVQMPELDGFGVLRELHKRGVAPLPLVIFTTAHDEFALRAFEVHALDYLLKPFPRERFVEAVGRARRYLHAQAQAHTQPYNQPRNQAEVDNQSGHSLLDRFDHRLRSLLAELEATASSQAASSQPEPGAPPLSRLQVKRLAVKLPDRLLLVPVADVDWIESAGNYVRLHAGRETHLVRETLSRLEARLDARRFVRIHRSTLVNIERIHELRPLFNGDHKVVLHDGTQLSLSRSYAPDMLARLESE